MKPLDEFSCVYIHKPRQPATGDPFPRSSSGQGVHERTPTPVRANLRLVVRLLRAGGSGSAREACYRPMDHRPSTICGPFRVVYLVSANYPTSNQDVYNS